MTKVGSGGGSTDGGSTGGGSSGGGSSGGGSTCGGSTCGGSTGGGSSGGGSSGGGTSGSTGCTSVGSAVTVNSTIRVSGSYDGGKLIRQIGGTTYRVDVFIDRCDLSNMKEGIFRTDSSSSRVTMTNTQY